MTAPPEVWAGLECSYLQVGATDWDQLRLTGHDRRPADIDLLQRLGVKSVRYPVLWGRSESASEATDWTTAEARVRSLHEAGIAPMLGLLHHGYGPKGQDPLDPGWPAAFARYAAMAACRLPAWAFLPVNEAVTTARFAALYGVWPPYAQDDGVFADLVLAHAQAARLAAREIRRVQPGALIVANEDCGRTEGEPVLRAVIEHYEQRRWLAFDLLTGRVDRHHPLYGSLAGTPRRRRILEELHAEPEIPDILGVDYYVTSDRFVAQHRAGESSASGAFRDVELVRVDGSDVGFARPIREAWDRYHLPVALTEVHMAGTDDDQIAWWAEAWASAVEAGAAGIPVVGVASWAVFGAVDWSSLLCREAGEYARGCFDVRGRVPRLTALGRAVARTARGRAPRPDRGWWRSEDRATVSLRVGSAGT